MTSQEDRLQQAYDLRRDLRGWQIFFIVASVIIGEGVFAGDSKALEVAGPGGALIALFLFGILAICTMECVSELVQLFPIPNAIVEYVKAFVDRELAWCIGLAYWYTYAAIFVALYLKAVIFASYWHLDDTFSNIILVLAPFIFVAINLQSVNVFGVVVAIVGFLKLCMVIGVGITMYNLHSRGLPSSDNYLDDGIEANPGITSTTGAAICYAIPVFAYSFIGVESVTVTAFEARDIRALRGPSRWIAWVLLCLYAFTLIGEFMLSSWKSPSVPFIDGNTNSNQTTDTNRYRSMNSVGIAVIVAEEAGFSRTAGFICACLVVSVLSGANSALYLASRMLYGLARSSQSKRNIVTRAFKKFEKTTVGTRVPALALVASAAAFYWVPFLKNLGDANTILDTLENTASAMGLIVWAALCAAHLRYRRWMMLCARHMERYARYNRNAAFDYPHSQQPVDSFAANTLIMFLQPGLAWVGLIGSLLVVLLFTTAPWWRGDVTAPAVFKAWASPIAVCLLYCGRRLWVRWYHPHRFQSGWVRISREPARLAKTLDGLECLIPQEDGRRRNPGPLRSAMASKLSCLNPRHKTSTGDTTASVQTNANSDGRDNGVASSPSGQSSHGNGGNSPRPSGSERLQIPGQHIVDSEINETPRTRSSEREAERSTAITKRVQVVGNEISATGEIESNWK